jgi:hypothetical protein
MDKNKDEPPSSGSSKCSQFLIGKDSHGHWVARDQSGLCGGLFIDRAEALKFAMFENGHRPQAVIMVPDILELDMRGNTPCSSVNAKAPLSGASGAHALPRSEQVVRPTGDRQWTR